MRVPILMYHSVDEGASPRFAPWVVTPDRLASHLTALGQAGYHPVTVSQLITAADGHTPLPERSVVITFDDGFADFRSAAFPILESFSFTCTLFVTTGYLGGTSRWLEPDGEGTRPMLTPGDVLWLAERGVEIGAHGHSHAMLDLLPADRIRREVAASKSVLERLLGTEIGAFAYPHGHADRRVQATVEELGFVVSCGVADAVASARDGRYYLPRLIVGRDTSADDLVHRLSGRGLPRSIRNVRAGAGRLWRARHRRQQVNLAEEASI